MPGLGHSRHIDDAPATSAVILKADIRNHASLMWSQASPSKITRASVRSPERGERGVENHNVILPPFVSPRNGVSLGAET